MLPQHQEKTVKGQHLNKKYPYPIRLLVSCRVLITFFIKRAPWNFMHPSIWPRLSLSKIQVPSLHHTSTYPQLLQGSSHQNCAQEWRWPRQNCMISRSLPCRPRWPYTTVDTPLLPPAMSSPATQHKIHHHRTLPQSLFLEASISWHLPQRPVSHRHGYAPAHRSAS